MSPMRFSRDPFSGIHGRARELAALRMSEPLQPGDGAWLEEHLAGCAVCRSVAEAYEAQRMALRRLPAAEPPRDLSARLAVAMDEAERRSAGRRHAGPAVRGRGDTGMRGSLPDARARHGRVGRGTSPALLGTFAAALVVAVVVGSTLLAGALRPGPSSSEGPTLALASAGATPIVVPPAQVVWASYEDDGTYALNIAPVDHVCPASGSQGCAPLDSSARKLVALSFQPKAVVLSQSRAEAVVVGPAPQSSGTSIFVVSLPSEAIPPSEPPSSSPGARGSPTTTASQFATSSSKASSTAGVTRSPTMKPSASSAASSRATSSGSHSPSAPSSSATIAVTSSSTASAGSLSPGAPSPAATIAILDNVVLAGEAASYSPDGSWFAFSARPADGSQGPDIYLWRVGEPEARAVTADHASIFSAWLGDRILGSTVSPESPAPSESPVVSSSASVAPADRSPSRSPSAPPNRPAAPASSRRPQPTPSTSQAPRQLSPAPTLTQPAEASPASSPDEAAQTLVPRSFAIDPVTGGEETIGAGIWRPVVDPTGTLVVYWRGTLAFDPASSSWQPAQGDLYLAGWSSIAPPDLVAPSPTPSASGSPGPTPSESQLPVVSVSTPATGSQRATAPTGLLPSSSGSTPPRPPRPIPATSSPSGGAEIGTVASGSAVPSASDTESAAPSPSLLAPVLLSPDDAPTGLGPTSWDLRWDATGTHLAVWVADAVDPTLGRLSLLTVDPLTARADPSAALLTATPALPGFSLDAEHLAWVTPPGEDGQGSQLQVLAWRGSAAGTLESLPIPDTEQLIVAR